ncbi:hypothetical protein A5731_00605 [Mycolicibacterium conceptionense]|uniref:phage antirepressor KilAC domain-containing protein n=1 Tax=Mycolicibacterium conceptionense TaxID=451644 RepID=UPI0007EBB708|nr:phage antirepressor KilAC domain-containing protein [Mycolicibacterium conceptionense]OBB15501.1 hypothetical protein A5718_29995 [Mycolicibacterium conceptionense]OBF09243.1 hypothetical protein A5731_00605 [Mycolicibacterium conceptionense]
MSDLQITNGDQSPFDAARQVRGDGSEFWSARTLCKLVNYETWRNFVAAIERAKIAIQNSGEPLTSHVVGSDKLVERPQGGSIKREDYELSRFGAYLVVMNGDPTKPEIASAQAYFAIKARQAEVSDVTPRRQAELVTKADLARMVLEIEEEKAVLAAALESAAPMIAYHDRYISNDDAVLIEVWGAQFGLTRPQAFALLVDNKLIYRRLIMKRYSEKQHRIVEDYEHRAYARYLDWFDLRPQHNVARHHNGQVRQTLYVRQEFALQLAEVVGLKVAQP